MRGSSLSNVVNALGSQISALGSAGMPKLPMGPVQPYMSRQAATNVPGIRSASTGFGGSFGGGANLFSPDFQARRAARMPAPWEMDTGQEFGADPLSGSQPWAGGGGLTTVGGNWAALDVHNPEIAAAAQKYGVPPNLLKAMINRESSGDWNGNNRVGFVQDNVNGGSFYILPFVGIKQAAAASWGLDWNAMQGNKQAQIDGMAKIVSGLANQLGSYEDAAAYYFGGPDAINGTYTDAFGMTDDYYQERAVTDWKYLDSIGGGGGDFNLPTIPGQSFGNNWVVQQALSFVGTPYVWGSIPGAGQDPRSLGWDCSGMTYWLDQNYGDGSLPMGSHYQYQYAQQTGKLFNDVNQLQAGDLVFWDTGNTAGGGANLNNAGHVAIYIGNGKILHAANPTQGTIVSDLNSYLQTYGFLGAMHQSFSGGGGFSGGFGGGTGGLAGDWSKLKRVGW